MSGQLRDALLAPDRRAAAVDEFVAVVDAEVASKSGLSGAAVGAAYAAVTRLNPTIVRRAVASMLPDFLDGLDPLWAARGEAGFADVLGSRSAETTAALLRVTDERAANPRYATVSKVYRALRPRAAKHVVEALPRLGHTVERLMSDPSPGSSPSPGSR